MRVRELLPLFRVPNLLIILLSQALPYGHLLHTPTLDVATFTCLSLATLLTALAGYVINDLFDVNIDRINKPERAIIGRMFSRKKTVLLYVLLQCIVIMLAFYLDIRLKSPPWHWPLLLFPGVSLLLFFYSWKLKCTPLAGNLLVAVFCGLPPLLVLIPEYAYLKKTGAEQTIESCFILALFAFFTNLFREQLKDLEDLPGDSACGCRTLPVRVGVRHAKYVAAATGIILSALLTALVFAESSPRRWITGSFLLLLPALWATWRAFKASDKRHYTQAGLLVKLLMFFGLWSLVFGLWGGGFSLWK